MAAPYSTTTYALFIVALIGLMGLGIYYDRTQSPTIETAVTEMPPTAAPTLTLTPINLPPLPDSYRYALMTDDATTILNVLLNPDGTVTTTTPLTIPSPTQPLTLTITTPDGTPHFTLLTGTRETGLHTSLDLSTPPGAVMLTATSGTSTPTGIWFADADDASTLTLPPAPEDSFYEASLAVGTTATPFARFTNLTTDTLDIFFERTAESAALGEDFMTVDTVAYPGLASFAETNDLRVGEPFILIDLVIPDALRLPVAQLQLMGTTPLDTPLPLTTTFHAPALYLQR